MVTESPEGVWLVPSRPRAAMLVLSGSSGRVATERVRMLAAHGIAVLAPRWFGPSGICEIPLESFLPMLDQLAEISPTLGVLGLSKGAEAALLLAASEPRIDVVVGLSPSHVAWSAVCEHAHRPQRSSWTVCGEPVPFIPYDNDWEPETDAQPIAYRSMYAQSLRTYAELIPDAAIPVERIKGQLLLAAGEDDQLWPSATFAEHIVRRRIEHGQHTTLVTHPRAGHRPILPGEGVVTGGQPVARGGTPQADAELGALLWPEMCEALGLDT